MALTKATKARAIGVTTTKSNVQAELDALSGSTTALGVQVPTFSGSSVAVLGKFLNKVSGYAYGKHGQSMFNVVGYGSSVANGATIGGKDSPNTPIARFFARLQDTFNPAGIYPLAKQNWSVDGSSINDFLARDWAASTAGGVFPDLAVFGYGMNDFPTALYNAGQTMGVNGFPARLPAACQRVLDAGGDVVLFTTPHPHSARMNWSMPTTVSQTWPNFVAMPVSDNDIVPTAADSIRYIQWNGKTIPVSERFLRGNDVIRRKGLELGCLVLDVEKFWFDAIAEYGEDALFDAGQVVHPNKFGHENSYWKAVDAFFDGVKRAAVLLNDSAYNRTLETTGPALYPNPKTADIDLQSVGLRTNALVERDSFARVTRKVSQRGDVEEYWHTSGSPTTGSPGYTVGLRTRLRRGGSQNAGETVTFDFDARQGGKLLFHAWSSSLGNMGQMVELMVARTDNGLYTQIVSELNTDTTVPPQRRLFTWAVVGSTVVFTFVPSGTVWSSRQEGFLSSVQA